MGISRLKELYALILGVRSTIADSEHFDPDPAPDLTKTEKLTEKILPPPCNIHI